MWHLKGKTAGLQLASNYQVCASPWVTKKNGRNKSERWLYPTRVDTWQISTYNIEIDINLERSLLRVRQVADQKVAARLRQQVGVTVL